MKRILLNTILALGVSLTSCSDYLVNEPSTGLSDDKFTNVEAMDAVVTGAYTQFAYIIGTSAIFDALLTRDVNLQNNNAAYWANVYDHLISNNIAFSNSYLALSLLNTVAVADMESIEGLDAEKEAVWGDMYFARAFVNFNLNLHYELPSTGYTAPLVLAPVAAGEKVSCATTDEMKASVESDIEMARTLLKDNGTDRTNYYAATALAARIYFFHKKYDLAYERANEVIGGPYALEQDLISAFPTSGVSNETIFVLSYNASSDTSNPIKDLYDFYQADDSNGTLYLNPTGELNTLLDRTDDMRYAAFYTELNGKVFINKKYSTSTMNYPVIRLPEMLLTRAESNIMKNNSVSQADVDDLNEIINRAYPANAIGSIPSKDEMLERIYVERTLELVAECGDHVQNVKRLQRGIVQIQSEGDTSEYKSYDTYKDKIVSAFPSAEEEYHSLDREP